MIGAERSLGSGVIPYWLAKKLKKVFKGEPEENDAVDARVSVVAALFARVRVTGGSC